MRRLLCVAALAASFVAPDALAWGRDGHRVVALMAERLIKGSHAEQEVAALLKPGETLESIANWADCLKGDLCGPQDAEMQAFVLAHPHHTAFHYTNVPFQLPHYTDGAVGTHDDDIVQTLKRCIAVLQGKDTLFTKRQALMMLVHLVGDLHQPLHASTPYVDEQMRIALPQRETDIDKVHIFSAAGANDFLVDEPDLNEQHNKESLHRPLHSFWDATTVRYAFKRARVKDPDQYADWLFAHDPAPHPSQGLPADWIYQWEDASLQASQVALRDVRIVSADKRTTRQGGIYMNWNVAVPADYMETASVLARSQLNLGGHHLGELLKAIWP